MSSTASNTLGKYQIIREIARSNDIIYEAVDPTINRRVALKELNIPPDLQGVQKQERIERFWREGKAAGRLTHPNIVSIFEVGKDNDRYFIAMEFLEGQNLADTLAAAGPMSVAEASNIAIQLCDALDYAHQNGVIHRDIKPANVHILPNRHVKLTDFGIARLLGESAITRDGQVFGTPSYMSPEQISGKDVDHRSDIYSVGVLLYEMVTAQKPFQGDSIVTITYNIMNQEPPVPSGVPQYYTAIIKKAMAKDPDKRYNNALELMNDLREQKCENLTFANQAPDQPYPYNDSYSPNMPQNKIPTYNTSSVPDPFVGSSVPQTSTSQSHLPPSPMPYTPPKPMMSAETKNFLGIFLISMAVLGFVIITALLISKGYKAFEIAKSSESAIRYYNQAVELEKRGDIAGAIEQFQNAIRVSPKSDAGKAAKEAINIVLVNRAVELYNSKNNIELKNIALQIINANPNKPEGYFFLGSAEYRLGNIKEAESNFQKATELGGNDQYAQEARNSLFNIYVSAGDSLVYSNRIQEAIAYYEKAKEYANADRLRLLQERIENLKRIP